MSGRKSLQHLQPIRFSLLILFHVTFSLIKDGIFPPICTLTLRDPLPGKSVNAPFPKSSFYSPCTYCALEMPLSLDFMRCGAEKSNFGILIGCKQGLDPKFRERQFFPVQRIGNFPELGKCHFNQGSTWQIKKQLCEAFLKITLLRVGMFLSQIYPLFWQS